MKVILNSITGIPDAIESMFMSKRSWTPELAVEIREVCEKVLDRNGFPYEEQDPEAYSKFTKWIETLTKMTRKHITVGKFIGLSFTVEGLHRGAQDDFDSHAKRLDNRIIRSSTRLAKFANEKSDYYLGKIFTTDEVAEFMNISLPDVYTDEFGNRYVKVVNGYVLEELKENKDVLRGLYMLSIPSNFVFQVNLTEWSHIYKERGKHSSAAPELKQMVETAQALIESKIPKFSSGLMLEIQN